MISGDVEDSAIALLSTSLAIEGDSFGLLSATLLHDIAAVAYINTEKYLGGREGGGRERDNRVSCSEGLG